MRPAHIGETVAGTDWTACREDTMLGASMPAYVQGEVQREIAASKLFDAGAPRLIPKAEVDAFCAQTVGFVIRRVPASSRSGSR